MKNGMNKKEWGKVRESLKRSLKYKWSKKEKNEIIDIWEKVGRYNVERVEWDYRWCKRDGHPNLKRWMLAWYERQKKADEKFRKKWGHA